MQSSRDCSRLSSGSCCKQATASTVLCGTARFNTITPHPAVASVQEASCPHALSMLSGLRVCGAADARLQLHSVLAGGKRRVTAEFCQTAQDGAAAALKLQSVRRSTQEQQAAPCRLMSG